MPDDREHLLRQKYGELLSLADVAEVLHFPSVQAVQKARQRGTLGLPAQQPPGRRGWFVTVRAVAAYLNRLDQVDVHHPTPSQETLPKR